jgi:gas vesicle protein
MSTVSKEVKGLDSNKPAQKQRRVTSNSSEMDATDDSENIKSALIAIQDKLNDLVTKHGIRNIVKSVVAEFKEEIKEKIKQELKNTVKEELLSRCEGGHPARTHKREERAHK